MKTMLILGVLAVVSCEKEEKRFEILPGAVEKIAENMGKAEAERFLLESHKQQLQTVENCRKSVLSAETPQELALAENDLRAAQRELEKIERELDES